MLGICHMLPVRKSTMRFITQFSMIFLTKAVLLAKL